MILVMSETIPLSAVKAHLSELVDRVQGEQDRIVVTRNGRPAAVIVSQDELDELEETLATLSDASLMAQLRESEATLAKGERGSSLKELREDLSQRRSGDRAA